jgi:hypothetical protein
MAYRFYDKKAAQAMAVKQVRPVTETCLESDHARLK